MIDVAPYFESGYSYDDFLRKYGTADQRSRWSAFHESIALNPQQLELLKSFSREVRALCFAGAWCGDCIQQCPILRRFEEASSMIKLRFVDRDAHEQLKSQLTICGGARVPQVVFLNEENQPLGWYGDRTLARYRAMASSQLGASCPTGIGASSKDSVNQGVIQDWLNEFERVHWIARLSPRLRQKHND
jgi:Thioredoxin